MAPSLWLVDSEEGRVGKVEPEHGGTRPIVLLIPLLINHNMALNKSLNLCLSFLRGKIGSYHLPYLYP